MILCVGLSPALGRVIELQSLSPGEVNRANSYLEVAAGKATNAARVARQLGHPATVVSPLGEESASYYRSLAEADGVQIRGAEYPGRIRWAITLLDPENGATEVVVNEPQPVPAEAAEALEESARTAMEEATACLVAGSRLPNLPRELLVKISRAAIEAEVPLFLDIREEDLEAVLEELARARAPDSRAREGAKGGGVVVKVNEEEFLDTLRLLEGQNAGVRELSEELLGDFARKHRCAVVVTRGGEPVLYASETGEHGNVPVSPVAARNPIGSGDTFLATLAVRLLEQRRLPEAVRDATAMAGKNATFLRPGTVLAP